MKIIHNSGSDRVIDLIRPHLQVGHQLGCVTPTFSLFAFAELRQALAALERVQLLLPPQIVSPLNPALLVSLWSLVTPQAALWSVYSKIDSTKRMHHEPRDESLRHSSLSVNRLFFMNGSLAW